MQITVVLNQEEAQSLLNLMDAAVRAQGLAAAQIALPIVQKLQQAAQGAPPQKD